jgi:hypothetical protein
MLSFGWTCEAAMACSGKWNGSGADSSALMDSLIARRDRIARSIPPGEPAPVPLIRKAVNLAGSAVRHVAAGKPQSSPELVAARLAVCRVCDQYRASDGTCGGAKGCGCFVERKARWAEQACPIGKWPTVSTQESS